MSTRNNRNTRRGRAKRWRFYGGNGWSIRGHRVYVQASDINHNVWVMWSAPSPVNKWYIGAFGSLARAKRAAEHLARLVKPRRATWAVAS